MRGCVPNERSVCAVKRKNSNVRSQEIRTSWNSSRMHKLPIAEPSDGINLVCRQFVGLGTVAH